MLRKDDGKVESEAGRPVFPFARSLLVKSTLSRRRQPDRRRRTPARGLQHQAVHATRNGPLIVQRAESEFARTELANHKHVMVLHNHQANPHVHLSVRAESICGKGLNPRKADLQRWAETFAEKLRGYGVEAEATRQATLFQTGNSDHRWRLKAREDGRLRKARPEDRSSTRSRTTRTEALRAWLHIGQALAMSPDAKDVKLDGSIAVFLQGSPVPVGLSRMPPDRTEPMRMGAIVDHEVRR